LLEDKMPHYPRSICWFRRDLRLTDHAALYQALKNSRAVHCVFVFDTDILDQLEDKQDRRVEFIWRSLRELNERLQQQGSILQVLHGRAEVVIPRLARELNVQAVFCNHDTSRMPCGAMPRLSGRWRISHSTTTRIR